MPKNLRILADNLHSEYLRGMPDGLDEKFFIDVEILFNRIKELEHALEPFAQTGYRIWNKNETAELVHVHRKDLVKAIETMDPANAVEKARPYYFPA